MESAGVWRGRKVDLFYWIFLVVYIAIVASIALSVYVRHLRNRKPKKAKMEQLIKEEREWRKKMADRGG